MQSTSILPWIMTMYNNFKIFFIVQIFIHTFKHFHMIPAALLLITSNCFHCVLSLELKNCFLQSLPLSIVVIEKSDAIWLFFVEDEFLGFFYIPFSIIPTYSYLSYYTLKTRINNKWCFIRLLILIKCSYFSVFRRHNYITKIFIFTYFFMRFTFLF